MDEGAKAYFDYVRARSRALNARFELRDGRLVQREGYTIDDPVLARYLFTNNYRELDTGTVYAINNIIVGNENEKEGIVFSSLLYRIFNLPGTYDIIKNTIGEPIVNPRNFLNSFDKLTSTFSNIHGQRIFSRAYIISASYGPKWRYNFKERLAPVAENSSKWIRPVVEAKDAKEAFMAIYSLPGIGGGGFLAYEIYGDIMYSGMWPWSENSYVNIGPGAKKGIQDVLNIGLTIDEQELKKYAGNTYLYVLDRLWCIQEEYLGEEDYFLGRKLSKRNVEHTLCEFHKYVRRKEGKHHGERLFRPKTKEIDLLGIRKIYSRWRAGFPEEFI